MCQELTFYSIRTMKPVGGAKNAQVVLGQAFSHATVVEVRWAWLVFLVFQVLLSLGFLAYTIVATQRGGTPVLKSSARPTLLALDEGARAAAAVEGEMEGRSVRVRLEGERLLLVCDEKG